MIVYNDKAIVSVLMKGNGNLIVSKTSKVRWAAVFLRCFSWLIDHAQR